MVAHPRTTGRAGRIRQLNRPRPVRVEADGAGRPIAVWLSGRRYAVEAMLESWRIDDEWWRPWPMSRVYYSLLLDDGRTATVYTDLVSGKWWKQTYST